MSEGAHPSLLRPAVSLHYISLREDEFTQHRAGPMLPKMPTVTQLTHVISPPAFLLGALAAFIAVLIGAP